MRTQSQQNKHIALHLVDQQQIWLDMALPKIFPLPF